MDSFYTIKAPASAEIEEKKSRFIASLAPVESEEEALMFLEDIRAQHRMARHNVYAYIVAEGDRVRYSDDGEPSKTAGLPTLEVLQGAQLKNIACVVTRYFGGTLLGTGGLVRAYSQATKEALKNACLLRMEYCVDGRAEIPYEHFEPFKMLCAKCSVELLSVEFTDKVHANVRMRCEHKDRFEKALREMLRGADVVDFDDPAMNCIAADLCE